MTNSITLTSYLVLLLSLYSNSGLGQVDYTDMDHWLHHPDKTFNQLRTYNLDIAVIGPDGQVDEVIEIENNGLEDTGVDIFWVHPTYVDPATALDVRLTGLEELPPLILGSIALAQGGLLAEYGRFFAPRYRQATSGAFFTDDLDLKARVIDSAYQDVKAAFNHYLDNHNNGNRFILAGHSQGSYHLSFLLHDVIEQDPDLADKMVMAALGGMSFMYAPAGSEVGGNLQHIRHCQTLEETSCYVTWRTYQDGQVPVSGGLAVPARDEQIEDIGLVHQTFEPASDQTFSDNTYYTDNSQPLDHYILPVAPSSPLTPAGVRFAAYNDYYGIRHQRFNDVDYGHMVSKIYQPDDERDDDLAQIEASPGFALSGYHQKDYNIYIWALREQVKAKLEALQTTASKEVNTAKTLNIYPNPAQSTLTIEDGDASIIAVRLVDLLGKAYSMPSAKIIDVRNLPGGCYHVQAFTSTGDIATSRIIIQR
jgi:hypothetical protein